MSKINIVSKILQKSDIALSEAVKIISQVKHNLIKTCTEFMFKELISNTKTVSEEIDAETVFPIPTRPHPRNRFFNYEAVDEPITDPESNCTINFYYYLLDTA